MLTRSNFIPEAARSIWFQASESSGHLGALEHPSGCNEGVVLEAVRAELEIDRAGETMRRACAREDHSPGDGQRDRRKLRKDRASPAEMKLKGELCCLPRVCINHGVGGDTVHQA